MSIPTRSPWSSPAQNTAAGNAELQGNGYGHFGKSAKKSKWPYLYIPEWSSPYAKSVCNGHLHVFQIYAAGLAICFGVFQLPPLFKTDSATYSLFAVIAVLFMFGTIAMPFQHLKLLEQVRRPVILAKIKGLNSLPSATKKGLELEKLEKDYESFAAQAFYGLQNMLASSASEEPIRAGIQKLSEARKLNPIIDLKLCEIETTLDRALEARAIQEAAALEQTEIAMSELQSRYETLYERFTIEIDKEFQKFGDVVAREFERKTTRNVYGQVISDKTELATREFLGTIYEPFTLSGEDYFDSILAEAATTRRVRYVPAEDFEAIFSLLHDYITEKVKELSLSVVPIAADMTPIDFEHHVASELRRYGWEAEVTKASGDQGIDVIASRGRFKVGIQCKYYKGSVPNKAVQEAYTGKSHYNLHGAAVVTTGTFTKSALEVAATTGVVALNHHLLSELHLRFGLN